MYNMYVCEWFSQDLSTVLNLKDLFTIWPSCQIENNIWNFCSAVFMKFSLLWCLILMNIYVVSFFQWWERNCQFSIMHCLDSMHINYSWAHAYLQQTQWHIVTTKQSTCHSCCPEILCKSILVAQRFYANQFMLPRDSMQINSCCPEILCKSILVAHEIYAHS